jgi:pimeloyl-ACP methyl ester carboxylesterase
MSAVRRLLFVAVLAVLVVQAFPPSLGFGEARQSAQRDGGRPALAAAEDRFVAVNGLRLHVVDSGGANPPLILLHGIARHAHTFDHLVPEFSRRYRVIAVDMRGHGDSAWSPEGAYLVQDYVKDLEGLIAELRLRNVTLLGNSTGGRVAQVYAGRHPDNVARLVVEDVGPERPQNIADAFARRVEQEKDGWASEDELVAQLVTQNRRTPEPLLRTYAHYGLKKADGGPERTAPPVAGVDSGPERTAPPVAGVGRPFQGRRLIWKRDPNLVKGFVETDLWDSVRKITAPTLYVIGGGSRIVPPETQQKLKDTLPNVRIVVMPGLGHYPDEEDTAGFMTIVGEFLR